MRMTKKPMMAKRATKAAPAKKTMAAKKKTMAAKKPMTVAGKTVKKYQVGGPAMGTMPKGMAGTLGSPRAKPTTTVTPVKTPPKTVGMQRPTIAPGMNAAQMRQAYGQSMGLNKAEAQRRNAGMATDFGGALGGAQPPKFTNYGPGSGQFQQEAPPAYQYNPQTSGRSDPRAIAARQEQERQRIMQEQMMQGGAQVIGQRPPMPPKQGMISNNGGALGAQSPDYAQASQLLSRMDPRSPFYNAIQQRVQQMGGMQSNNGAGMIANNPGAMVQAGQGGLFGQPMGTQGMPRPQIGTPEQERARMQQMMAGNSTRQMTPQQIQAQQDAMRQQLMQAEQQQLLRGHPLLGLPGGTQQQMGVQGLAPGTPAPRQAVRESPGIEAQKAAIMQGLGARQFRKGGAVAKKKKPAATTRGRMAKPARKR